jgi:hypothetical protein
MPPQQDAHLSFRLRSAQSSQPTDIATENGGKFLQFGLFKRLHKRFYGWCRFAQILPRPCAAGDYWVGKRGMEIG